MLKSTHTDPYTVSWSGPALNDYIIVVFTCSLAVNANPVELVPLSG
jgi:hypothetical protein